MDGIKCNSAEAFNTLLKEGTVKPQIILYTVNKDGHINFIDTVKKGAD